MKRRDFLAASVNGAASLGIAPAALAVEAPPPVGGHMKRVTGIGGVSFKAKDAPTLRAWYKLHLGIDVQGWGGAAFDWTDAEGKPVAGTTAWLITTQESKQFAPSAAPFMINYRVDDLHGLIKVLKEEGCEVLEKIDESEFGKYGWVIDQEGNKGNFGNHPPARDRAGSRSHTAAIIALCSAPS